MAAADLVSNPIINVSIGTKMPPPPTPPTVPQAEPRNPITVAATSLQLGSKSFNRKKKKKLRTPVHINEKGKEKREERTGQVLSVEREAERAVVEEEEEEEESER